MNNWFPQPASYLAMTLVSFLPAGDLHAPSVLHAQSEAFSAAAFLETVAFLAAVLVVAFFAVFFVAGICVLLSDKEIY